MKLAVNGPALRRAVWCSCLLASSAVWAGRGVDEPALFHDRLKSMPPAAVDAALAGSAAAERCKDALTDSGLRGTECRALIVGYAMAQRPLDSVAAVDERAAFAADAAALATSLGTYEPLSAPPGFQRSRFDAMVAACRPVVAAFDALSAVSAREAAVRERAQAVLAALPVKGAKPAADPSLRGVACGCALRVLDLTTGADASLEERGALQGVVTSHRCGLDESRLRTEPKPGAALAKSENGKAIVAAATVDGTLKAYAQTRAFELSRCETHLTAAGRPKDKTKLETCVCGAMKRWRFPARDKASDVVLEVPGGQAQVGVDPAGALATCALK